MPEQRTESKERERNAWAIFIKVVVTISVTVSITLSVYTTVNFNVILSRLENLEQNQPWRVAESNTAKTELKVDVGSDLDVKGDINILHSALSMAGSNCRSEGVASRDTGKLCYDSQSRQFMASESGTAFHPIEGDIKAQLPVTYTAFERLNQKSVDIESSWSKLNISEEDHKFHKKSPDTKIEVLVNSRIGIETLRGRGVVFQIRIDDQILPSYGNLGTILAGNDGEVSATNIKELESIVAVFEKLSAGDHTVSIWAKVAPNGIAQGVTVDPGGWGGAIIVKETY